MKRHIYTFVALCIFTIGNAQNCIDFTSSKKFDFDTMLISKDEKELGKAKIVVKIFDRKKQMKVQTIVFDSEFILKSKKSSRYCENNKSYPADVFLESVENDFGDLIVADLNFDGNEDIAIKREEGGNGGPIYNFYIQSGDNTFVLNDYLSNEMFFFPNYLNSKQKTLTVRVRIDSSSEKEITYFYSEATKTWNVKQI